MSIHHPNLINGSNSNTSPNRRRSLTIRYIPTSTRILARPHRPAPTPLILRGTPVTGVNEYQAWPRYEPGWHMPFRGCDTWS